MPMAFFTRTHTGALVSRLNNDVIGAQRAFTSALSGVVTNVIALTLTLVVMLGLSWQITVLGMVLLPIFLIPARRVGAKVGVLEREAAEHNAAMTSQMTERFSAPGATLVKLFGRPDGGGQGVRPPGSAGERHRRALGHGDGGVLPGPHPGVRAGPGADLRPGRLPGPAGRARRRHRGHPGPAPHPPLRAAHRAGHRPPRRRHRAGELRAGLRGARHRAAHRRARRSATHAGRAGVGRVRRRALPLPVGRSGVAGLARGGRHPRRPHRRRGAARCRLHGRAGPDGGAGRPVGCGQVDAGVARAAALRHRRRRGPALGDRRPRPLVRHDPPHGRRRHPGRSPVPRQHPGQPPVRRARMPPTTSCGPPSPTPGSPSSSGRCPTGSTPSSASAATACPAASGNGSRSPGCCSPTRGW